MEEVEASRPLRGVALLKFSAGLFCALGVVFGCLGLFVHSLLYIFAPPASPTLAGFALDVLKVVGGGLLLILIVVPPGLAIMFAWTAFLEKTKLGQRFDKWSRQSVPDDGFPF